jgi:hypothetical protein
MFERGVGKFSFLRLNARPFDREAIGIETELRQQGNICWVAVVMVAGITGRFGINGSGQMFQNPALAVNIVSLYLMGGSSGAPEKVFRKNEIFHW